MPIIRKADVEFSPGSVENTMRRALLNPDSGSGAVTLNEVIMNPGSELPLHTHIVEEAFFITKGIASAVLGDETYTLEPSDVMLAPAGIKHTLANRSNEPMGFLCFYPAVEPRMDLA